MCLNQYVKSLTFTLRLFNLAIVTFRTSLVFDIFGEALAQRWNHKWTLSQYRVGLRDAATCESTAM